MALSQASLLARTRTQLERERTVRAQGAARRPPGGAAYAHFAAVMGNAIHSELDEMSEAWQVSTHFDSVADVRSAAQAVADVMAEPEEDGQDDLLLEGMIEAVENSVVGVMCRAKDRILEALANLDSSPPTSSNSEDVSAEADSGTGFVGSDVGSETDREAKATDALLNELEEILNTHSAGKSTSRMAAQTMYREQIAFISSRAIELQFVQKAMVEVSSDQTELKRTWPGKLSAYFSDAVVLANEKQLENMTKEQTRLESRLQRYFDCASQGATSLGSSEKSEKVKLTIATELESNQAGYRQIQLVDLYCLNRGSTMWAIIPDLYRVGHDIDPIACLHWRPNMLDLPEEVRPYYAEQNAAFAKKLLALCNSGFRTTLLGEHKHGVKKEAFRAEEQDGVSIYWVMVQLHHPIGRARRRALEEEIGKFSTRLARGRGDPAPHLKVLREKHQEAMEIACRLKWDVCALPIVTALMRRDPLLTVRLERFLELPTDPDDSVSEFGDLITTLVTTVSELNFVHKAWDEGGGDAKAAKESNSKVAEMQRELTTLKALVASGHTRRPAPHDTRRGDTSRAKGQGFCEAKGCDLKIDGWASNKHWKLCATCLLNLKSTNTPIKLKDGGTFGGGKKGFPKACQAQVDKTLTTTESSTLKAKAAKAEASAKAAARTKSPSRKRREQARKAAAKAEAVPEKRAKVAHSLAPAEEVLYY
jgi:uncharacterized protein YukE